MDARPVASASAPSHWARIHMAGPLPDAERVCREFCFEAGLCVTVTPTRFIYTGGEETGFVVGLLNYPRFPTAPEALRETAEKLGHRLMHALFQGSYLLETPSESTWFSRRGDLK